MHTNKNHLAPLWILSTCTQIKSTFYLCNFWCWHWTPEDSSDRHVQTDSDQIPADRKYSQNKYGTCCQRWCREMLGIKSDTSMDLLYNISWYQTAVLHVLWQSICKGYKLWHRFKGKEQRQRQTYKQRWEKKNLENRCILRKNVLLFLSQSIESVTYCITYMRLCIFYHCLNCFQKETKYANTFILIHTKPINIINLLGGNQWALTSSSLTWCFCMEGQALHHPWTGLLALLFCLNVIRHHSIAWIMRRVSEQNIKKNKQQNL